jgi:hypothetical protein
MYMRLGANKERVLLPKPYIMKRIFCSSLLAVTMLLTGCVKEVIQNTKQNPATDFNFVLTRIVADGTVTTQYENALNLPGSAQLKVNYEAKENLVYVNIGGYQLNTVVPRLYLALRFFAMQSAAQTAGHYTFPADTSKLDCWLAEQIGSNSKAIGLPSSGTLDITYDSATKCISGTINNLRYPSVLDNRYKTEVLNGRFSNVAMVK